ncbi:hypothetical protein [Chromobacterium sp.]|uniref:hypothetical protein n=1 Tax=Chromobacterium sp. TaxID=306190 RepID=UPI0035B0944B
MTEAAAALAQWGKWLNDSGSWRGITPSIEGRYANDPERYRFAEDKDTARRRGEVRYNPLIAGQVERVVNQLAQGERAVLRARHVHYPHLADEDIARRLAMSAKAFDGALLQATVRFGRAWRRQYQEVA